VNRVKREKRRKGTKEKTELKGKNRKEGGKGNKKRDIK
jgi:hypothetical protein